MCRFALISAFKFHETNTSLFNQPWQTLNRLSRRKRRDSSTWWGKAWPRSAWALAKSVSVASQTRDWYMMSSSLKGPRWLLSSMYDWLRYPEEEIITVTAEESLNEEASGRLAATAIINTGTGNGDSFRTKITGSCTAAVLSLHTRGAG